LCGMTARSEWQERSPPTPSRPICATRWQAVEGVDFRPARCDGGHGHLDLAPEVRSKVVTISSAMIDRACSPGDDGATRTPTQSRLLGGSAQHSGAHLLRLGGSVTGVHGSGSGGSQWSDGARQLHPDAGPVRHRHRLDRRFPGESGKSANPIPLPDYRREAVIFKLCACLQPVPMRTMISRSEPLAIPAACSRKCRASPG
jgi:hypothetical protein